MFHKEMKRLSRSSNVRLCSVTTQAAQTHKDEQHTDVAF